VAEWPADLVGLADWVMDVRINGSWYRPATAEYVSWLIHRNRARMAFLEDLGGPAFLASLRANFLKAASRMPILEIWWKCIVDVPPGYRPPGQPPAELGPPYPATYYTLEDLSEQDKLFLGRQHPEVAKRFPELFPPKALTRRRS